MPQPPQVKKAILKEIWWDSQGSKLTGSPDGHKPLEFEVQFNPQSLKVTYSNQSSGGDQSKQDTAKQFVGRSTTKLSLELWFDVALAEAAGRVKSGADVRVLTQQVAYFLVAQQNEKKDPTKKAPPGIRLEWGSFSFEGVMDSMDETIEFFSPDGVPLRASVSISLSQQNITIDPSKSALLMDPKAPGLQPLQAAKAGESLQQMAAKAGISDWKAIARINNVENPRQLAPGTLLKFSM
jgi:hypothetical protein